jgi:hypothetical protein
MPSLFCEICGRGLRDAESIALGIGPVCRGKVGPDGEPLRKGEDAFLPLGDVRDVGLICKRLPDGTAACNVRQALIKHSPDGFEWGYSGSGPADLALNVLAELLPAGFDRGAVYQLRRGKCSGAAMRLYQDFKAEFIAGIPRDGGSVSAAEIRGWVSLRLRSESA